MHNTTCVAVIGNNDYGEFGLGHCNSIKKLTINECLNITNIISGFQYSIYCDITNNKYWSAGINDSGSCGCANSMMSKILTLTEIKYFQEHQINIKKVCASPTGYTTFWIDDGNNLYGCGRNTNNELGVDIKSSDGFEPQLIPLTNVTDVAIANSFSIALCNSNDHSALHILKYWTKLIHIPPEILHIILVFYRFNEVYMTSNKDTTETLLGVKHGWALLNVENESPIVQISTGYRNCLLLEQNGTLWGYGSNSSGQLGLGHRISFIDKLTKIQYFIDENIKVTYIKCGGLHSLALDNNGKVYSFGYNSHGQCGTGTSTAHSIPKVVKSLIDYKVIKIDCSCYNSYCMTSNGKHFLFGTNRNNECITFDNEDRILSPYCINDVIADKYKKK
eukprot:206433_1